MRATTRKVQTAFRLDAKLLSRLKRKAKAEGRSVNTVVEETLNNRFPAEPELPHLNFPLKKSKVTEALHIAGGLHFSEEELATDHRLRHILGLEDDMALQDALQISCAETEDCNYIIHGKIESSIFCYINFLYLKRLGSASPRRTLRFSSYSE